MEEAEEFSWTEWLKDEMQRHKSRWPQRGTKRPQKVSGRYVYKKLVELGAVDPEPQARKGKRSSGRQNPVDSAARTGGHPSQPGLKRMSAGGAA